MITLRNSFHTLVLLIMTQLNLQGQEKSDQQMRIDRILEHLIELRGNEMDVAEVRQQLEYHIGHPMDINRVSANDLMQLLFLSPGECNGIVQHRKKYGDFLSLTELQSVAGLSEEHLYLLPDFVTLLHEQTIPQRPLMMSIKKGTHSVMTLYDKPYEQNENAGYSGSAFRNAFRYRFTADNRIAWGYTGEKDVGEPFIGEGKGYDFNSFYFWYKPTKGILQSVVVGDYLAGFGQGLTLGMGYGVYKSAYITQLGRTAPEVSPFRSFNEAGYLRGIATVAGSGRLKLTVLYSGKKISAGISEDGSRYTTLPQSGLNRSDDEIEMKNKLMERLAAAHVGYAHEQHQAGITAVMQELGLPPEVQSNPYRYFEPRAQKIYSFGADFQTQWRQMTLGGEVSISDNGAVSGINWLLIPVDHKLDIALLWRRYDKKQPTRYIHPFSDASEAQNETGLYSGLIYKITRKLTLGTYLDIYRSPWLRYRIDASSTGHEGMFDLNYAMNKRTLWNVRFKTAYSLQNEQGSQPLPVIGNTEKNSLRIQLNCPASDLMDLRFRLENVWYQVHNSKPTQGTLLFGEAHYQSRKHIWSIIARATLYSIEAFENRVYVYEQDIPGRYAMSFYQHNGIRNSLLLRIKPERRLSCWFKYAYNRKFSQNAVSLINTQEWRCCVEFKF